MKKLKLLSLVGIISIALANAGWAAGHGGGGGGFGGGGHFGGSSFHGGAFRGGGLVTGGVGTRGGGVGFGAMRPSHGVPNFAGAGSRFSSFGRPSSRQPVYDGRPTRSMTQSGRITASREQGARPEVTRQLAQRFPSLSKHIAAQHDASWHNDWDRRHVHFDHGRFFVFIGGFWCGLDDGFFPWDYLPYYPDDY